MKQDKPIAIFDSGVGGLTVYQALRRTLPRERFIYLGDTARVPYGTKSAETVAAYSLQNSQFLVSLGVKMLVVACNTASSYAMETLVDHFDMPVLGVIPAGVRRAVALSRRKRIGVIATESTIQSQCYQNQLRDIDVDIVVHALPCPLFVPLVEEGWLDHPVTREVAQIYLAEMSAREVDTLILGCTHYPMLKAVISAVLGAGVNLVDSAEAVALEIGSILTALNLERRNTAAPEPDEFYVTDSTAKFQKVAEIFLSHKLENLHHVDLTLLPKID
ncbi:MAG: glutamate racemase [Acidobacteria bacterium]|nr:glutamate racemase [Acidobacteriota bacterium]